MHRRPSPHSLIRYIHTTTSMSSPPTTAAAAAAAANPLKRPPPITHESSESSVQIIPDLSSTTGTTTTSTPTSTTTKQSKPTTPTSTHPPLKKQKIALVPGGTGSNGQTRLSFGPAPPVGSTKINKKILDGSSGGGDGKTDRGSTTGAGKLFSNF